MRSAFAAGVCVDLGAFDPTEEDAGVGAWMRRAQGAPAWVCLMEDRQPTFFHGYRRYEADEIVPLNRHGPNGHTWTQKDVRRLVAAFHDHGVKVLLGYWIHECGWVDHRHPELLIRDQHGDLWQDDVEMNADFSPLRRMRADPEHDVHEGERYGHWSARRYARLAHDFGFDGLFLGDGGMGFRRHGKDWKDLRHFDFHEDWVHEFAVDHAFDEHEGCMVTVPGATTQERADDIKAHHWEHWVDFNCQRWTAYYRDMASAVHATGGILAAYNCMNYDPALARLHGVDYAGIAASGLDILVFQSYDYAWGPLGPFGFLHIARKDLATNLATLLRTRAEVGHRTPMQIVVTVETEDEVEGWNSPTAHTLGELHALGQAVSHDGHAWRRAADGAFIVWGNSVKADEWRALADAFAQLSAAPPEPAHVQDYDVARTADLARAVPTATEVDAIYAHLAGATGYAIRRASRAQAPRAPAAATRGPAPQ